MSTSTACNGPPSSAPNGSARQPGETPWCSRARSARHRSLATAGVDARERRSGERFASDRSHPKRCEALRRGPLRCGSGYVRKPRGPMMQPRSTAASPPTPSHTPYAGVGAPSPEKNTIHTAAPCARPAPTVEDPASRRPPSTSDAASERGASSVPSTTAATATPATPSHSLSAYSSRSQRFPPLIAPVATVPAVSRASCSAAPAAASATSPGAGTPPSGSVEPVCCPASGTTSAWSVTGGGNEGAIDAAQAMVDYQKETVDRAERERARLLAQLEAAVSALHAAVDKLSSAVKEHYDRVAEVDRLRVHVKENILYYMQAIWRQEPPDQRFFRLYDLDVPIVTADADADVPVTAGAGALGPRALVDRLRGNDTVTVSLPMSSVTVTHKKLSEVADLDNVLAYKGNYMVFPLKENNYVTLHMMQDYLEVGDEMLIRAPHENGDFSIDDLRELATCVHKKPPDTFRDLREDFERVLMERLTSRRRDNELVVVPTSSLYIDCLVGTHPLLEDFKLIHRALDVKRVQAEVRHAELENVRLAARAMQGQLGDPDIDKVVVVGDNKNVTVDAG